MAPNTISAIYKRCWVSNVIRMFPWSRKPRKITSQDDKAIIKAAKENHRLTALDIHKDMVTYRGLNTRADTIRLRLVKNRLFGCRQSKKPLVSAMNRKN